MPIDNFQYSKDDLSGGFDRQASYYAAERGQSPWFCAQVEIVLKWLDPQQGLILDIGCAAGAEIEPLRSRGFRIVGIDYSEKMLGFAQRQFAVLDGVHFCRADAESLPFASASFDQVVCLGVFEYLSTYDRCLEEIRRVLRPGGVVIISVPTRVSLDHLSYRICSVTAIPLWRAVKKLIGKPTSGQPIGQRWNRCIPWQVPELLRQHGLNPERRAYSGFLLFPLGELWPAFQFRLFEWMERFSESRFLGPTLSQYVVRARKTEAH